MDHYIEIRVLPDPEFHAALLMSAVFAKLHRALCDVGRGEIGVSFPGMRGKGDKGDKGDQGDKGGKGYKSDKPGMGDRLRLHGGQQALARVMEQNWLKGLRDYTEVSPIAPAPAHAEQRAPMRRQFKSSPERLLRRSVKTGRMSQAEAQQASQRKPQLSDGPFLRMKSASTAQEFCLFIEAGPKQAQAVAGKFSDYGLSQQATVPWF